MPGPQVLVPAVWAPAVWVPLLPNGLSSIIQMPNIGILRLGFYVIPSVPQPLLWALAVPWRALNSLFTATLVTSQSTSI